MSESHYEQTGTVIKVLPQGIKVRIERKAACADCHARAACSSLDKKSQTLDIECQNASSFSPNELVTVIISETMATKAVFIAFIVPTILLIAAIALLSWLFPSMNSTLIALISLFCYAVFCFCLYKTRHRIGKRFTLSVRKKD